MRTLRSAAPLILLATLVLRLPGFVWQILGIDDSDFTLVARAMAQGAVPFRDVVDIKPPLTYLLYLPNAWFGEALWPVQVEGALAVAATALLLGLAARRTWQSERAGVCAAFLALGTGLCEAPTVSTELLMNLPTAGALLLFARAEEEGGAALDLVAGALLGLAALIRHQAVFTLGALGLSLIALGLRADRPWLWRCVRLSLGFALPWAAALLVFQSLGALPDFLDWVIVRNLRYVGQSGGSALLRFLESFAVCLLAAAPLCWWLALDGARKTLRLLPSEDAFGAPGPRLRLTWVVLLAVSWVPVSLGGRFYEHYFLQFVPAVALLGAGPAAALLERWPALAPARRKWLTALALLPAFGSLNYGFFRGLEHRYPLQDARVLAIGAWVRDHTAPTARLFVWGHYSPIYLAAGRLPGTRYLTTSWHLGNFDPEHLAEGTDLRRFRSDRDVERTLRDLATRKPELVIDTTPADIHSWHKLPLSLLPDLEAAIDQGWEEVAVIGGARVLRRRDLR